MDTKVTKEIQTKAQRLSLAVGRAELLLKAAYVINMQYVDGPSNEYFASDHHEIVRELLGTGISLLEGSYGDASDVSSAIGFDVSPTWRAEEHLAPPQLTEPRQRRHAKAA